MPNLPRIVAAIGATLLITVAASCGSDSAASNSTPSTTPATTVVASSDGSTGVSTAGSVATAATATGGFDDRTDIVNYMLTSAMSSGVQVDSQCLLDVIAQLSDADAKILGEGARAGSLAGDGLSPEGQALGQDALNCAVAPTSVAG
ncbi:MAG: hypothetical protein ABIR32_14510, partial [Ilumatobacteraceae bacterium]